MSSALSASSSSTRPGGLLPHALNPLSLSSSVIPPLIISSKLLPSKPPHALHCPTQTSLLTFSLEKTGPCPPLTWKEFQFRTRSQVRSEDISADFLRMLGGMLRRNLYVSCTRSFLGETASNARGSVWWRAARGVTVGRNGIVARRGTFGVKHWAV